MSKVRAADTTPSPVSAPAPEAARSLAASSRRLMRISLGPMVGMNQTSVAVPTR